jgi:hypothetical protein
MWALTDLRPTSLKRDGDHLGSALASFLGESVQEFAASGSSDTTTPLLAPRLFPGPDTSKRGLSRNGSAGAQVERARCGRRRLRIGAHAPTTRAPLVAPTSSKCA